MNKSFQRSGKTGVRRVIFAVLFIVFFANMTSFDLTEKPLAILPYSGLPVVKDSVCFKCLDDSLRALFISIKKDMMKVDSIARSTENIIDKTVKELSGVKELRSGGLTPVTSDTLTPDTVKSNYSIDVKKKN